MSGKASARTLAKSPRAFLSAMVAARLPAMPVDELASRYRVPGTRQSLPRAEVEALLARDLLRPVRNGFEPSPEALALLKREAVPEMPFRVQHGALESAEVEVAGKRQPVLREGAESPLAWLHRRRGGDGRPLVSAACFAAGERLREDFTFGQLSPRITTNWSRLGSVEGGDGGGNMTEVVLAARQRVRAALEAVGPELSGILLDVCCFLKGLEAVERDRGWPVRSGKVVLTLALERLARHYGLADRAMGSASRAIRTWSAA